MGWPVVAADFNAYFTREFVYGSGNDTVTPADVTRALLEATMTFNEELWDNDLEKQTAFLYLTAHFLVLNVQAAGGLLPQGAKGIKSGGGGVVSSKSVGSVSVSYALPQAIIESPILGQYMRTDFGQKYLSLVYPRLVGNIGIVGGQPLGVLSGE